MRRAKRRHLGGTVFECLYPGHWISQERVFAIVHMMVGTMHDSWELFRIEPDAAAKWPKNPADVFDRIDWSWEDLGYHITMGEVGNECGEMRQHSAVMLPRIIVDKTVVVSGQKVRLVRGIQRDTDCGAILRVQGGSRMEQVEFWSTYGCHIAEERYMQADKFQWLGEK